MERILPKVGEKCSLIDHTERFESQHEQFYGILSVPETFASHNTGGYFEKYNAPL